MKESEFPSPWLSKDVRLQRPKMWGRVGSMSKLDDKRVPISHYNDGSVLSGGNVEASYLLDD